MLRCLILLFAVLAAPALAQPVGRTNAIRPELVAEGPIEAGGEVELAIVMHTQPGWHGYWLNPGDAGLPMEIDWQLPKAATLGPLRFPVPERLLVAGIVNYVYERDHAILVRLKLGAYAGGTVPIRASARWLACTDQVCVPEQGSFSLDLPVGGSEPFERARFDQWRQALPRPLSSPARFAAVGDRIEIAIPMPADVEVSSPYFFPADDGPIDYGASQQFRRKGDLLIASLERRRGTPSLLAGVLALGDGRGLEIRASPGPVPQGGSRIGDGGTEAILYALLGAVAGGMLLNLMPCVFPILALKALHLSRSGGAERQARRDALAYAAGAVVGTGGLGLLLLLIRAGGTRAGWAFQLQDPGTILVLMVLAVAITLNLLRLYEIPVLAGGHHPGGSFGTGALAAFVATPCAGPFLGAALGTALLLPLHGSVLVFAALGLGLAIPFLLIAFVPALRRRLPRPGPWMARLQRILAIPMGATALACLWLIYRLAGTQGLAIGFGLAAAAVALLAVVGGAQRGNFRRGWLALLLLALVTPLAVLALPDRPATSNAVPPGAEAWSAAKVARYRAEGRPLFVYFTADWCLTCKANEAAAINREAVRKALDEAGVRLLVGDWTSGDPEITRLLESRGRAGVPLYLWYEPGQAEPEELAQILTPAMLIERAERRR